MCVGQVGAGAMILLLPFVGCDREAVIYVLAVFGAVQGFNLSGFSANMLDIAPNFSGEISHQLDRSEDVPLFCMYLLSHFKALSLELLTSVTTLCQSRRR